MREYTDLSKPTMNLIINHAEARLNVTYGRGAVRLPSPTTAYRILAKLDCLYPLFSNCQKRNRDIAGRPVLPYGKMHPARPGEYVLMDTTHLDVFAMDPHTLRCVGVDLTVAMDWYSRCITGLRLTPVSTKAIDAASPRPVAPTFTWSALLLEWTQALCGEALRRYIRVWSSHQHTALPLL